MTSENDAWNKEVDEINESLEGLMEAMGFEDKVKKDTLSLFDEIFKVPPTDKTTY